jgi:radical SAM protein (TIGR01212 family)
VNHFTAAVRALHDRSLPVCAHVILGLPGATREHERRTAELLADLGVWGVKLHAFHVVEGTLMAERYRAGEIELLSLDEHAQRVVDFVERLPADTVIHRITAEAPPRLTVAPSWTVNKLAAYDRVVAAFTEGGAWQGRLQQSSQRRSSSL